MDVYTIITERIIAKLEAGTVPWRRPWHGGHNMPRNIKSDQPYRGVNVFVLASAGYCSPYWLTFKQAHELGGTVKRGERSTPVVFWRWLDKKEERDEPGTEARPVRAPLLRFYAAFNVEQCDGVADPSESTPAPTFNPIEQCDAVVRAMPTPPRIEHNAGGALYRPTDDLVSVPRPEQFSDPATYYCTLYHELGHYAERRIMPLTSPSLGSQPYIAI